MGLTIAQVACLCWTLMLWTHAWGQTVVRSRISDEWRPRSVSGSCSTESCGLPSCYCHGQKGPSRLQTAQIPQMVMLTFDDAVNEQVFDFYQSLLTKSRRNPNGCRISATFYISHNWTDYGLAGALYGAGHELASHTISHRLPQAWWGRASLADWHREVAGQRDNLVSQAGVARDQVRGMRAPFLELGGDKQFTMMGQAGLTYDSSFMVGPYERGGAWPFTLDFPPDWRYCSNNHCPKSSFPGLWELPMNRWVGPDGKPCSMVDACQSQPLDHEDALGFMWYNFNRFYRGNRAPFGIHLHAVWFRQDAAYLRALDTFIVALTAMDDVYLVTASQVIDWMRDPTPLRDIKDFSPWKRSCQSTFQQSTDTSGPLVHVVPMPRSLAVTNGTDRPRNPPGAYYMSTPAVLSDPVEKHEENTVLHAPAGPSPYRKDMPIQGRQPILDNQGSPDSQSNLAQSSRDNQGSPDSQSNLAQSSRAIQHHPTGQDSRPKQSLEPGKMDYPQPLSELNEADQPGKPRRPNQLQRQDSRAEVGPGTTRPARSDNPSPDTEPSSLTPVNMPGSARNSASKEQVSAKQGPRLPEGPGRVHTSGAASRWTSVTARWALGLVFLGLRLSP